LTFTPIGVTEGGVLITTICLVSSSECGIAPRSRTPVAACSDRQPPPRMLAAPLSPRHRSGRRIREDDPSSRVPMTSVPPDRLRKRGDVLSITVRSMAVPTAGSGHNGSSGSKNHGFD
jgi:hypothetical protein